MSTDKETIENYNKYAQKWAKKLREGKNTAHEYLEKPAMYSKLPTVTGKSILCIGCGTGEECDYLLKQGAKRVVGVDISSGLIEEAKKSYPEVEFYEMDMEKLEFPEDSFDFVYSSLVMHYLEDWKKALANIYTVIKPGAIFLFSTHHPAVWGAERNRDHGNRNSLLGYKKNKDKGECEIFGDYLNPRKINDIWFNEFEVSYYHRPMEDIIRDILVTGFTVVDFLEPKK
jgi:SAM-dependent methyltransferase